MSDDYQPSNDSDGDVVDQWKCDLVIELALEFALRNNDPGFVEAVITDLDGREEEILKNSPRTALLMACHTILTDFKSCRYPPKTPVEIYSVLERLLGLELEFGRFHQFKEVLDRVCVQLVLILFRQYPEQYDEIESAIKQAIHRIQNDEHEVVLEACRKRLEFIRNSPTPRKAFEDLEQRCPYNSAVNFVHHWLKTVVMKFDQPYCLDALYATLETDSADEGGEQPQSPPPAEPEPVEQPAAERDDSESHLPNINLSLNAIRQAFPGSDKQFRLIWRQTHPRVIRYLKETRQAAAS